MTSDQATLVIATSLLPNLQLVSGGGVEMARGAHTDCKQAAAEELCNDICGGKWKYGISADGKVFK